MDRITTRNLLIGCLIHLFSFPAIAQQTPLHNLGKVTQAHGTVTYLPFKAAAKVQGVLPQVNFLPDGSYLTHEQSFLTAQIYDGSWLRLSPRSKISLQFDQNSKVLTIHLYMGSVKILIAPNPTDKKLTKIIVKSGNSLIETSEAKFSVVRNTIFDTFSVYVEKGMVQAFRINQEPKVFQYVHAFETLGMNDKNLTIGTPRKMNKKELKFLKSGNYLKNKNI